MDLCHFTHNCNIFQMCFLWWIKYTGVVGGKTSFIGLSIYKRTRAIYSNLLEQKNMFELVFERSPPFIQIF